MDKERIDKIGYDAEEAFFDKLNRDKVKALRERLDAERAQQVELHAHLDHWLRCPKCGSEMKEFSVREVQIDQCMSCHGTYFDAGELELLMQSTDPDFVRELQSKLH